MNFSELVEPFYKAAYITYLQLQIYKFIHIQKSATIFWNF